MAKPKGKKAAGPKKGKSAKGLKPFLGAFLAAAACLALAWWVFDVYGWSGSPPSITVSGWPAALALVFAAACGIAYWRGGKPVLAGVLVAAAIGAWAFLTFVEHALPRPF